MSAAWLSEWVTGATAYTRGLNVRHFRETARPAQAAELLGQMIREAKCDTARLRRLLERVSWFPASARLAKPKTVQLQHGDFGEVVAMGLIEVSTEFRIPVIKLRTQVDADQSLHGTDIVGFAISESPALRISDMDFAEVKVRTSGVSNARKVAVEAHKQLIADAALNFTDVLDFVAQRLEERDPQLSLAFDDFLADRNGPDGSHRIVIVIEEDDYSDDILANLADEGDLCEPLEVDVVHVDDLKALIASTWPHVPVLRVAQP